MKNLLQVVVFVGSLFHIGCNRADRLWEDGNYRVYARPHSRAIIMGYHFGDGGVLGLSEPTVIAAGADDKHVVFQVNEADYFYIVRESDVEGTTHGPFDKNTFAAQSKESSLPPFEWHLQK